MSTLKNRMLLTAVSVVCAGVLTVHFVNNSGAEEVSQAHGKERARVVLSQALAKLNGDHLKAVLVEVDYGPGEGASPHSHPCPVIGYVVEGAIRSQVKGHLEKTYKAGETFYEEPNGIHAVSANASATEPAKLLAYFVCDHESPLSVNVPESTLRKGETQ